MIVASFFVPPSCDVVQFHQVGLHPRTMIYPLKIKKISKFGERKYEDEKIKKKEERVQSKRLVV